MLKPKSIIIFFGLTIPYSCNHDSVASKERNTEEKVIVANRNSGSISFVDVSTNEITKTLSIPNSEPMYVVYVSQRDRIYVGDRLNKKVHVINPSNYDIEKSISVGEGVFHMWADGQGKEIWVVNDIDYTISVLDLNSNTVSKTITIDKRPHDVFLTQDGSTAFVSVFTENMTSDKVYKYSTNTYLKTGEVSVGKEPHLFHLSNNSLYVPCQSGRVYAFNSNTLNPIFEKIYQGAHGIFSSINQNTIFVSNITNNQLYSINSITGESVGTPISSSRNTPHNIVLNKEGNKMFITHSGATSNSISIYNISSSGHISPSASINVENNPFGLTYYKREIK
ncbi:hypothetical protein BBD32_12570 [Elizabethkingia anophelis]|uniref:YncE family protein n=1 Tax=Elizabethkingia anophelis TaxID=1117645 RepID=A0AAU8V081_9FLAO|nr:hypothetical protein BBD32_12570 [Elizabethkingia anophelis]OPB61485.1 hypothetical protein BAY11_17665 [Elizabethkingia anophelis]